MSDQTQFHRPWRELRAEGYRRCICDVQNSHAAKEAEDGERTNFSRKGQQCRNWCDPERIARVGLPICYPHEEIWREATARDAATRAENNAAMRAKYDPGPLYDDD